LELGSEYRRESKPTTTALNYTPEKVVSRTQHPHSTPVLLQRGNTHCHESTETER
jgi:hypothetical protein